MELVSKITHSMYRDVSIFSIVSAGRGNASSQIPPRKKILGKVNVELKTKVVYSPRGGYDIAGEGPSC